MKEMSNSIEEIIQQVAEKTSKCTVLELRKQGMMKDDKQTPFQKVEILLYNYNNFLAAIADKEENIAEIAAEGLRKHCNSVIPNPGKGTKMIDERSYQDKIDERIAEIEGSIEITRKFIKQIENELNALSDEVYYDLIRMKYFEGKTHEEIADHFNCDVSTISRQKNKMINMLQIKLFSNDFISGIFC